MGNITILVGIGLFSFLLVYMIFKLSNANDGVNKGKSFKHTLLQLLLLFFLIGNVFMIGKVVYDDKDHCNYIVNNQTITGNTTSYNYEYLCTVNENNTAFIFYRGITYFSLAIITYLFVYFVYEFLVYLNMVVPKE